MDESDSVFMQFMRLRKAIDDTFAEVTEMLRKLVEGLERWLQQNLGTSVK